MPKTLTRRKRRKGRRNIMLPESFVKKLREVREEIGAKSDSEVIRRAFKLLKKLGVLDPKVKPVRSKRKNGKSWTTPFRSNVSTRAKVL